MLLLGALAGGVTFLVGRAAGWPWLTPPREGSGAEAQAAGKSPCATAPLVFSGAIDAVQGEPSVGDTVSVIAADGTLLARAAYSPVADPGAGLELRAAGRIDADFFRQRIERAVAARAALQDDRNTGCRLVHAEADGLPGVVADRYGEVVVVQLCRPARSAGAMRSSTRWPRCPA